MPDQTVNQYEMLLRSIEDVKKARIELVGVVQKFQIEMVTFCAALQRIIDTPEMQAILQSISDPQPGSGFCRNCPDREACLQGAPCLLNL